MHARRRLYLTKMHSMVSLQTSQKAVMGNSPVTAFEQNGIKLSEDFVSSSGMKVNDWCESVGIEPSVLPGELQGDDLCHTKVHDLWYVAAIKLKSKRLIACSIFIQKYITEDDVRCKWALATMFCIAQFGARFTEQFIPSAMIVGTQGLMDYIKYYVLAETGESDAIAPFEVSEWNVSHIAFEQIVDAAIIAQGKLDNIVGETEINNQPITMICAREIVAVLFKGSADTPNVVAQLWQVFSGFSKGKVDQDTEKLSAIAASGTQDAFYVQEEVATVIAKFNSMASASVENSVATYLLACTVDILGGSTCGKFGDGQAMALERGLFAAILSASTAPGPPAPPSDNIGDITRQIDALQAQHTQGIMREKAYKLFDEYKSFMEKALATRDARVSQLEEQLGKVRKQARTASARRSDTSGMTPENCVSQMATLMEQKEALRINLAQQKQETRQCEEEKAKILEMAEETERDNSAEKEELSKSHAAELERLKEDRVKTLADMADFKLQTELYQGMIQTEIDEGKRVSADSAKAQARAAVERQKCKDKLDALTTGLYRCNHRNTISEAEQERLHKEMGALREKDHFWKEQEEAFKNKLVQQEQETKDLQQKIDELSVAMDELSAEKERLFESHVAELERLDKARREELRVERDMYLGLIDAQISERERAKARAAYTGNTVKTEG